MHDTFYLVFILSRIDVFHPAVRLLKACVMPKAIYTNSTTNRTTGIGSPGIYKGQPGTVLQHVHDGDTLNVVPQGNIGVRFLGIDTPEVSFAYPGPKLNFVSLNDARWNEFLSEPFSNQQPPFQDEISDSLKQFLLAKVVNQPGTVHSQHAEAATTGLRSMITADMRIMGQDASEFAYYLSFGFEIMDGYGRFLCMVNRNQPKQNVPTVRPATYNHRMLQQGLAFPYFIWPNVNPWDRPTSVINAVIPVGSAKDLAEADQELRTARQHIKDARTKHLGVFDATSPCLLEPFELRALSRRNLPSRYVIDLTRNSDQLIPPAMYHTVPNSEDRLWIPPEYVPLFVQKGWKVAE